jgi:hypothetical protein
MVFEQKYKIINKSNNIATHLAQMTDASRLKKHIQLLCEKLSNGASLPQPVADITAKASVVQKKSIQNTVITTCELLVLFFNTSVAVLHKI